MRTYTLFTTEPHSAQRIYFLCLRSSAIFVTRAKPAMNPCLNNNGFINKNRFSKSDARNRSWKMNRSRLSEILSRATHGHSPPTREEIVDLLSLKDIGSIRQVMSAAQKVRNQYFDNKIYLYGFIYFSTHCRNHCAFCFYRRDNKRSPRYRKNRDEVVNIARMLAGSGVHLIDLTLGEDPLIHDRGEYNLLFDMIDRIKDTTGLPVMISPGVVPDEILWGFGALETDWYALYQETHNPDLFTKLRIDQSFTDRSTKRETARRAGMLVEDGILLGVGETVFDRADSIMAMQLTNVSQARVMSFVPQSQTPLGNRPGPSRIIECLCIAVMRLAMPNRLIPASLDVDGINGLKTRLEAGANVVTSIIPPRSMLVGVSQSSLDIEQGLRTVPEVKKVLSDMGQRAAKVEDYTAWVATRKKMLLETARGGDEPGYSSSYLKSHLSKSNSLILRRMVRASIPGMTCRALYPSFVSFQQDHQILSFQHRDSLIPEGFQWKLGIRDQGNRLCIF